MISIEHMTKSPRPTKLKPEMCHTLINGLTNPELAGPVAYRVCHRDRTNESPQPLKPSFSATAILHRDSKNIPPLACYNFDTREQILTVVGRNVIDKVSHQKTLYYATSNNLCFCATWQDRETRKLHFSLKCCISALREFNQSLLDFFNLRLTTHTHAAV